MLLIIEIEKLANNQHYQSLCNCLEIKLAFCLINSVVRYKKHCLKILNSPSANQLMGALNLASLNLSQRYWILLFLVIGDLETVIIKKKKINIKRSDTSSLLLCTSCLAAQTHKQYFIHKVEISKREKTRFDYIIIHGLFK